MAFSPIVGGTDNWSSLFGGQFGYIDCNLKRRYSLTCNSTSRTHSHMYIKMLVQEQFLKDCR